ncbi:hypothetical protein VbVaMValp1_47 [Vibrio phage Vb_VaM_Valp1]
MIVLASHTGWQLSELMELPISTLVEFLELCPKKEDSNGNAKS